MATNLQHLGPTQPAQQQHNLSRSSLLFLQWFTPGQEHIFWSCHKVLCCSDLAKGKSLSNLNCQETSMILLFLGQGVSIRG